jgi:hypothetical protein
VPACRHIGQPAPETRALFQRVVQVESARKRDTGSRVVSRVARMLGAHGEYWLYDQMAGARIACHVWNVGADVTVPVNPAFGWLRPVPGVGEFNG